MGDGDRDSRTRAEALWYAWKAAQDAETFRRGLNPERVTADEIAAVGALAGLAQAWAAIAAVATPPAQREWQPGDPVYPRQATDVPASPASYGAVPPASQ